MAYTFFKAQRQSIGKSLCEDDFLDKATELLERTKEAGCEMVLPVDTVVATEFKAGAENKVVAGNIEPDWKGMDIGPDSEKLFTEKLVGAKTIVWNGPVGVFEFDQFGGGTTVLSHAIANSSAFSLAGGGDTVAAVEKYGVADKISYISTGGGSFLEFLEGKKLPALAMLEQRAKG